MENSAELINAFWNTAMNLVNSELIRLRSAEPVRAEAPQGFTPDDADSRMQDAFFAGVTRADDPRPIHENYAAWKRGE